jgi:hypothetical protein
MLNEVERALYKSRKSLLEVCREFDVEYTLDSEISLGQCASCGIWLRFSQFRKDLDGLDICNECYTFYGP